ncbi:MAG: D-alanyl-D-alanine carboxypeptidase family protein [Acidimicrobiales bacterium]
MSRFGSRSSAHRVAGVLAAAVVAAATLAATWAPVGASATDRPRSATPGFVLREGRYREFEAPSPRVEIFPSGINDRGYVTGEYIRPDRESGFVRDPRGRISTFDVPGARGTEAVKINDRRQIVGRYSEDTPFVDDSTRVRGYIRHRGKTTRIDAPDAVHTLPTGINDRGDVVGYFVDSGGTTHGFVWRDGRFTTLDVPDATAPTPVDINDRGDVVGLFIDDAGAPKGFLLSKGRYSTIAAPGAPTTIPFGINDTGQIVGYTADDLDQTGARGFLLAEGVDGPFTPINFPGAPKSVALGISDRGDVVGLHENPDLTPSPPATGGQPGSPGTDGQPPGMLSDLDLATVRDITVSAVIADQIEGLLVAAEADGLTLTGHGHRDHARQIALRRAHCGTSYYAIYQMPAGSCSPPTARPGTSMHERGMAIDFSCDGLLIRSRSNPCYRWLAANASGYGLYNLPSEAWHWSTNGS